MTEHEHDVPPRPAFVLQVRNGPGGVPTAWLDDEQVAVPAGVGIHRALILAARRRADRTRPGRTIRVAGLTQDGDVFHLAIGPDGDAWEVPEPLDDAADDPDIDAPVSDAPVNAFRPVEPAEVPEPSPAYHLDDEAPKTTAAAAPTAPLTDDLGRPIPTTTTQGTAHHAFATPAAAKPQPAVPAGAQPDDSKRAPARRATRPSRRSLLLGGAGVVVLAGAAAAGFFALHDDDEATAPTPSMTGTPLPDGIRPPAGLPASYLWSVVNVSDVSPQLAVTEKQLACTVDNDTTGGTQLVSLDAQSGKTLWKADLPVDAVVAHGPALVPVDGTDAIVLSTQTQLIAYPMGGGDPKTWPLEPKWSVALTRSGVIVTNPDDKTSALVLHRDKLTPRVLPRGAEPVALLADGTLVATDAHGRVWLSNDPARAPKPRRLKAPRGTTPGTFVAATGDQLITAFVPKDDPQASRLRAFSLPQLQPRITTAPVKPAVFPSNFMLAPDETWAVAGNVWVDMSTGDSHVITARWSPIAISQHNCWSKSGDNVLTATDQGRSLGAASKSSGQASIPHGGTSEVAYCVASVGSDTTLYAVPLKG